mmetsp:Transcript_26742/g.68103  ORF Transcript_26742/g.68103 Transcript_26742/m.68103 type:complete len:290 (-) Transcript_26742:846-1715(-)
MSALPHATSRRWMRRMDLPPEQMFHSSALQPLASDDAAVCTRPSPRHVWPKNPVHSPSHSAVMANVTLPPWPPPPPPRTTSRTAALEDAATVVVVVGAAEAAWEAMVWGLVEAVVVVAVARRRRPGATPCSAWAPTAPVVDPAVDAAAAAGVGAGAAGVCLTERVRLPQQGASPCHHASRPLHVSDHSPEPQPPLPPRPPPPLLLPWPLAAPAPCQWGSQSRQEGASRPSTSASTASWSSADVAGGTGASPPSPAGPAPASSLRVTLQEPPTPSDLPSDTMTDTSPWGG